MKISRLKDAALEKALLMLLRQKAQRYGEVRALRLDTSAKRFSAEIKLNGDLEPLTVSEAYYRVQKQGDQTIVIVYNVKVSKEWAQNLLDDYFREIPFKVPEFVRPLIE